MVGTTKVSSLIYYQNVRGLRSKAQHFSDQIDNMMLPLICLTETWLKDDNINSQFFPCNYVIYRNDRNLARTNKSKGGGVLIAVNSNIFPVSARCYTYDTPNIEAIWITTKFNGRNLLIGTIYLPPDCPILTFSSYLDFLSVKLQSFTGYIVILGDFNAPGIDWKYHHSQNIVHHAIKNKAIHVLNFASALNLSQINQLVPDIQMLDLCFTNCDEFELSIANDPLVPEDRHHEALVLACEPCALPRVSYRPSKPRYNKGDYLPLYNTVNKHNWAYFYSLNNVDDKVTYITETIQTAMSNCIPTSSPKISMFPIWFSKTSIYLTKRKNHFHKLFKRTGNTNYQSNFIQFRKSAKRSIKIDKITYFKNLNDNISKNPKKFWEYVKSIRNGFHSNISISSNNTSTSDPQTVSELFANKFADAFTSGGTSVPSPDSAHRLHEDSYASPNLIISPGMVTWSIKCLKPSFSKGVDNIPNFIVKGCSSILTPLLTNIFNTCLSKGNFPTLWKKAIVLPLHKKGCRHKINNYRPISLLCTFSKVFEKIIHKFLSFHTNNRLFTCQHGFVPKRTTTTNLLEFYFPIYDRIIARGQADCIYFDFSNAFDRVDHHLLLHKLNRVGINCSITNLLADYLSNRSFQVKIQDTLSTNKPISSGVPQGSCLSPLLFIIFMDDIHKIVKFSQLSLFADDLKISKVITSQEDCILLQEDINNILAWSVKNAMILNDSKTQLISYTRKHKPITWCYHLQGKALAFQPCIKDLGILFDTKLFFHHHIDGLKASSNRLIGLIKNLTYHATHPRSALCLFYSLIRSKLEYGCEVWNSLSCSDCHKLERVQYKFCSFIFNKFGLALNLQPLEVRRQLIDAIFLHKVYNNILECSSILAAIGLKAPRMEARLRGLFTYVGDENGLLYRLTNNCNQSYLLFDFMQMNYKQILKKDS